MTLMPVSKTLDLRRSDRNEGRRAPVNRRGALGVDGPGLVDRLADDVEDAAEVLGADRHRDRGCRCRVTSMPRTRPSDVSIAMARTVDLAEVLGDLEHEVVLARSRCSGS